MLAELRAAAEAAHGELSSTSPTRCSRLSSPSAQLFYCLLVTFLAQSHDLKLINSPSDLVALPGKISLESVELLTFTSS